MQTTLPVPPHVRDRVAGALNALRAWNGLIEQARHMEGIAGQSGRYEYELRYGQNGDGYRTRLAQAQATLAQFEALAAQNGVDAQAVYTVLGGKPVLYEEGAQVHDWRPSAARKEDDHE
jgi:hypothetical protein